MEFCVVKFFNVNEKTWLLNNRIDTLEISKHNTIFIYTYMSFFNNF